MKIPWQLFNFFILMFIFSACTGNASPRPVPTIVVDEACKGIVAHSFITPGRYELGQSEEGPVFGPYMVSFLNDGRAIWKYSTVSYIGTFKCEGGAFEATFDEGEKKSLKGTYSSETDTVQIEEIEYLKATEQ